MGDHPMKPITVLLADDHNLVRAGIRYVLQGCADIKVLGEAGTGHEALRLIEKFKPAVVLMDGGMPEMNGLEATRQIKSRPDAPVVLVVTLNDTPSCRAEARAVGADGLVNKAALAKELPRALAALLQRHDVAEEAPASAVAAACVPGDPPQR